MDDHNNFRTTTTFYDDINYPRGFSKHGDFTIAEAKALHDYGQTLLELSTGALAPESADEKQFVKVCQGGAEASTYIERLWLKYRSKIQNKQVFYGLYSSNGKTESSPEPEPMFD